MGMLLLECLKIVDLAPMPVDEQMILKNFVRVLVQRSKTVSGLI